MFASRSLSDCRNISKRVNMKRNKWILTLVPHVWCLVIVTLPSACSCIVDGMAVVLLSSLLGKFWFFQYMCVWKSLWHIVFWIVFRSTLGSYGKMWQSFYLLLIFLTAHTYLLFITFILTAFVLVCFVPTIWLLQTLCSLILIIWSLWTLLIIWLLWTICCIIVALRCGPPFLPLSFITVMP